MKKKIMFIFVLICIIVFFILYYIFLILGNNIFRNKNEFVEKIFKSLENYEAEIDVIVVSNKNQNIYSMSQTVNNETSKVVINSPENVKGLIIEQKNDELFIRNTRIDMEKRYSNYELSDENNLFIGSFVKDYQKNCSEIIESDYELIIKVEMKDSENTYLQSKELYIDKIKKIPTKLIIKDNAKKINTSIIYNDIKIK